MLDTFLYISLMLDFTLQEMEKLILVIASHMKTSTLFDTICHKLENTID